VDLQQRVDAAIDAALGNRLVGCVVLINKDGKRIYGRAAGLADRDANTPMREDTIFRYASVTKPIVATAALKMSELGLLGLDDPVTKFLPWFTPKSPDGSITPNLIRQLLNHTTGLSYANVPDDVSPGLAGPSIPLEENLRRTARHPLSFAPGSAWDYGMSIDVLGGVIASINGSSLEDVLKKYVTGPLGMADAHFYVTDPARLSVQYADGRPPVPVVEPGTGGPGDLGFSPKRIFDRNAPQSGGAGMAGTTGDMLKVIEIYNGHGGILQPTTIAKAIVNQIGSLPRRDQDAGKRFSYIGAVIDDAVAAKSRCPVGTVDWGGAWGHNWVLDPINNITIAVCTNTAPEGCNGPFRDDINNAVYA
jgi:CubicO group peptidase (beta-lactamase class C family)